MSNGDPPRRVLWIVLIGLVALCIAGTGILAWRSRPPDGSPASPEAPRTTTPTRTPLPLAKGADGVGDDYDPAAGATGYDALAYDIDVAWDPGTERLSGTTVMTARAAAGSAWTSLSFDLLLPVSAVLVNGEPADFTQEPGERDVRFTPAEPIAGGAEFTVAVTYGGDPAAADDTVWLVNGEEWTAAGEPASAPVWFPSNDHPSDPAAFDVTVTVPAGMEAFSVGRLVGTADDDPARDTWRYEQRRPVPTYAVFLSMGSFEMVTGTDGDWPYVYAVSTQIAARQRTQMLATLRGTGEIVRSLEEFLGPYPLADIGGVVPSAGMWFGALETAGRPVYNARSVDTDTIVHEMAHMWVGNTVTLARWDDIFDNEAMASFATWVYAERVGGVSAGDTFERTYRRFGAWQVSLADPGVERLFTVVYVRGPMAMQALRNRLGDEVFFPVFRAWAQQEGPRSLEQFRAFAAERSGQDLDAFFAAWIDATTAPARTAANGFD
ncbi:M1 family metallopeptidase [Propionicicella superfundia]|uniref:M1 family metallopeptidase n=1 Tax=Propionicicella superfundia TaxID=348582 RepID=UPI000401F8ED|nr:M1 family metallopeptidase [Propionicicella superfundia]